MKEKADITPIGSFRQKFKPYIIIPIFHRVVLGIDPETGCKVAVISKTGSV